MNRDENNPGRLGARRWPPLTESEALGGAAHDLVLLLNVEVDEWHDHWTDVTREWLPSDSATLHDISDFDRLTAEAVTEPDMTLERRREVRQVLNDGLPLYYEALPFSTAERRWIGQVLGNSSKPQERTRELLVGVEAEILDKGLRTTIKGSDVLRRWWSWRRQIDEFEGAGSFDAARCALEGIAATLMTKSIMPGGSPGYN